MTPIQVILRRFQEVPVVKSWESEIPSPQNHHHPAAQSIERLQLIISKSLELPPDVMTSDDSTVTDMDVSKNWGTPKWMVYKGKPY